MTSLQERIRWLTGVLTELVARACTDMCRPLLLHCATHPKLRAPMAASSLGTRTRCTAAERGCRNTCEPSLLLAACTLSSPSGKTATWSMESCSGQQAVSECSQGQAHLQCHEALCRQHH